MITQVTLSRAAGYNTNKCMLFFIFSQIVLNYRLYKWPYMRLYDTYFKSISQNDDRSTLRQLTHRATTYERGLGVPLFIHGNWTRISKNWKTQNKPKSHRFLHLWPQNTQLKKIKKKKNWTFLGVWKKILDQFLLFFSNPFPLFSFLIVSGYFPARFCIYGYKSTTNYRFTLSGISTIYCCCFFSKTSCCQSFFEVFLLWLQW